MWRARRRVETCGLDRLSAQDLSNLRVEARGLPMHVAALSILDGGPLRGPEGLAWLDEVRARIEERLHLAPRLRQVLYQPGLGLGPAVWVGDAGFDIERHVRTRAIAPPGDEAALLDTCVQLNQRPLDRSRPLWELWLLTGLASGDVAMLLRLHHVVADGTAALALFGSMFDLAPDAPSPVAPTWTPAPAPSSRDLLTDNLHRHGATLRAVRSPLGHPVQAVRRLQSNAAQLRRLLRASRAPGSSLNRAVGEHRRLLLVRGDLQRAKQVAHAHGATVNDVVLAAVAGGARALLASRAELAPGLRLRAMVPVSMRAQGEADTSGNRVGAMIVPLPVGEPDTIRLLEEIARTTAERKRQPPFQPGGRGMQRWVVHAMAHQRRVNLFTSNLTGPARPTPAPSWPSSQPASTRRSETWEFWTRTVDPASTKPRAIADPPRRRSGSRAPARLRSLTPGARRATASTRTPLPASSAARPSNSPHGDRRPGCGQGPTARPTRALDPVTARPPPLGHRSALQYGQLETRLGIGSLREEDAMQRTVQDVMTRGVVVAREATPFHELVALLSREHVAALPVIDNAGQVIGIVSESDLLLKEVEELAGPCAPQEMTLRHRQEYAKAAGTTAKQVMTAQVVTAYPEEHVAEAARRMHTRKVHQLPVVDRAGVLAGIITRADILKVFRRTDQEIRFELLDDIIAKLLRAQGPAPTVEVEGGVVTMTGTLPRRSQVVALTELARTVDGVVAVHSYLTFDHDDLGHEATARQQPSEPTGSRTAADRA